MTVATEEATEGTGAATETETATETEIVTTAAEVGAADACCPALTGQQTATREIVIATEGDEAPASEGTPEAGEEVAVFDPSPVL